MAGTESILLSVKTAVPTPRKKCVKNRHPGRVNCNDGFSDGMFPEQVHWARETKPHLGPGQQLEIIIPHSCHPVLPSFPQGICLKNFPQIVLGFLGLLTINENG
jgi:hypothetical protein